MNIARVEQRHTQWCRRKVRHQTAEAAALHAAGLAKKNQRRGRPISGVLVVYFCTPCTAYHVGHNKEIPIHEQS